MGVAAPKVRALVVLGNTALNGQERGNIEVYRALQGDGVDALFVTHAEWGGRQIEPYLARLGLRSTPLAYAYHFRRGMRPRTVVQNLGRVLRGSRAFWKIARAYRPTHVHVANPHYVLCVLPALWLLRVPVIYRLGDVPTLHAFYRALWRWGIVPLVWRFVCISEYVAEAAVGSGVPREKTRVVLSAPPGRPAAAASVQLPDRTGPDERTVLFLGQVAEHKGVDVLVEAAALLAERWPLRVLVAGRVAPQFTQRLGTQVLASGVADRVRFLGYVEDVSGLFAVADVHVCPSVCEEALGNVVLEAKQAGVPSVVFPSGGLPELVVEQGEDGIVCEGRTAEALAAGVGHYLALSPEGLAEAGQAARRSLDALGSDEATFRARWLDAIGVGPEAQATETTT